MKSNTAGSKVPNTKSKPAKQDGANSEETKSKINSKKQSTENKAVRRGDRYNKIDPLERTKLHELTQKILQMEEEINKLKTVKQQIIV